MNVAELIGELESAIDEAQRVGKRVQTAIVALRDIFGSVIPSSDLALVPSSDLAMKEPDMPRPAPEPVKMLTCPYCGKQVPEWIRPHRRDAPRFHKGFRLSMHIGQQRKLAARGFPVKVDHGQLKTPVPK